MNGKRLFFIVTLSLMSLLAIAACSPSPPSAPAVKAEQADGVEHDEMQVADSEHEAGSEHHDDEGGHGHMDTHSPDQHMAGMHNVPAEAAAMANPIQANAESVAAGQALYAANCALCHGESGEGDGPAAASLEKPPADLHAAHVQELPDGALFYIISHGRPDTPMPAWENILSEEERWQVVNYLRTFNKK